MKNGGADINYAVITNNWKVVLSRTLLIVTVSEIKPDSEINKSILFDEAVRTLFGDSLYAPEIPYPSDVEYRYIMVDKYEETYNIPEEDTVYENGKDVL